MTARLSEMIAVQMEGESREADLPFFAVAWLMTRVL